MKNYIITSPQSLLFVMLLLLCSCIKQNTIAIHTLYDTDDCPFYAVVDDTFWCGTVQHAELDTQYNILGIRIHKKGEYIAGYPSEEIYFYFFPFKGTGLYSLKDGVAEIYRKIDYDLITDLSSLKTNQGDTGEVEITEYNEDTNLIKGEVRFTCTTGIDGSKRIISGGRFSAYLE